MLFASHPLGTRWPAASTVHSRCDPGIGNPQRGIAVKVAANAGGSTVTWSGEFVAKGAEDAKAVAATLGIYDSVLAALVDKVK